jgi:hypothetical protein
MHGNRSLRQWSRIFLIAAGGVVLCWLTSARLKGQEPPAIQMDRDALLGHLNAVITWYRDVTSKVQPTGLPSDTICQDNAQTLGAQVVRLAFQSARAEADLVPSSVKAVPSNPGQAKPRRKGLPVQKQTRSLAQTPIQTQA